MKIYSLIMAVCCLSLSACATYHVESETDRVAVEHAGFVWPGLATAYAAANGISPFDGTILRVDVIPIKDQPGELLTVALWPILEVGIGFVGARVHVLPVEVGVGVLLYWPRPINYWDQYVVHERVIEERAVRDRNAPDVDVRVRTTP